MAKLCEAKLNCIYKGTNLILFIRQHCLLEERLKELYELITKCPLRVFHKSAQVFYNLVTFDKL